jgi:hypothetical protein
MNYNNSGKQFVPRLFECCKKKRKVGANLVQFKRFYSIEIYIFDKYVNTLNP